MKHLIIFAHPKTDSLNYQLKKTVVESLKSQNNQIQVRDLYQLNFSPTLTSDEMKFQRLGILADDVKTEQEFICWADYITFIYPIWWTGMPAILKGYIDRVFTYGFAYRYDKGVQIPLLVGKQTTIINTQGKSHYEYENTGMDKALALTSDKGIFNYCGMLVNKHFYFERADKATPENIERWKEQLRIEFN